MHYEFRQQERDVPVCLTCVDCGKPAQGNVNYTNESGDNLGEVCDDCDKATR